VLDGEDLSGTIESMLKSIAAAYVHEAYGELDTTEEENLTTLRNRLEGLWLVKGLWQPAADLTRTEAETQVLEKLHEAYAAKEAFVTTPIMRELERVIILRVVDEFWMDHLDAMTDLRQGITLRAYAQTDPVVEYKREGFETLEGMIDAIPEEVIRRVFRAQIRPQTELKREKVAKVTSEGGAGDKTVKKQPQVKKAKVGRNDPCPCGSGKKYKNCCLDKDLNQ
jgi:preprotein translocase subunit SecA